MEKPRFNLLLDSKILVGVLAAVLLVLGVILVVQGRIDTHNYRDQIIGIIQEQTGRQVNIKGKVSISLLPVPTIFIPGIELRDTGSDAPAATVDMIKLRVPVMSVFSDVPKISSITLEHPVLELVRGKDHIIHWEWLNSGLLKALAGAGTQMALEIQDGKILYHDKGTDNIIEVADIYSQVTSGNQFGASGSFTIFGHAMQFAADTQPDVTPPPSGTTPFHFKLRSDEQSTLQLQGGINLSGDLPIIEGKLDMNIANLLAWTQPKGTESQPLLQKMANPFSQLPDAKAALPLKLTGDWSQQGSNIDLNNAKLDGLYSTGTGSITLGWKEWKPVITSNMQFATLDVNAWRKLVAVALQPADTLSAGKQQENPLPQNMQLTLNVSADKMLVAAQTWQNIKLSAVMDDAAITVNQFAIALPGDANLNLFGIVSQGSAGGLRFEGSVETQGKSLRNVLTVFDESASVLPETGFGDFAVRSNIFISSEQLRLSEADVKLSDLRLNGGLVTYFDATPRMEADVRLKDINFDYFRNAWRDKQTNTGQQDFFLKFDKNTNFNWLKNLQTAVDLKVFVEDFTFLERKGTSASFRLSVKGGEFAISDMMFNYPADVVRASFSLNVTGEQPFVNVKLEAGELNTEYFSLNPPSLPPIAPAAAPADKKRWSEDLIDMSWMDGFSGAFDLSIGKLLHDGKTFTGTKIQTSFQNDLMTFKDVSFNYWQGRATVLGSMYGGKVPGLAVSFTLYDAELHDVLKDLVGRENITGKVSLTGTIDTSGVNYLSWLSQSDAKLNMAARGVNVQGFNLPGVINAVQISRTAADVFNSVNLALVNGSSLMSVDGVINIKGGVMKTPGVHLQSDNTGGDMTGEVRLIPWTMDLSTIFQFPSLSSETVPTMTVQLSGPIDGATMRTDTASLEAYVAKRIISK